MFHIANNCPHKPSCLVVYDIPTRTNNILVAYGALQVLYCIVSYLYMAENASVKLVLHPLIYIIKIIFSCYCLIFNWSR